MSIANILLGYGFLGNLSEALGFFGLLVGSSLCFAKGEFKIMHAVLVLVATNSLIGIFFEVILYGFVDIFAVVTFLVVWIIAHFSREAELVLSVYRST